MNYWYIIALKSQTIDILMWIIYYPIIHICTLYLKDEKVDLFQWHVTYIVKPVYKSHSREPENVAFMSSCPS